MKNKEKKFLVILVIISIVLIFLEQILLFLANKKVNISDITQNEIIIGTCDVYGKGVVITLDDKKNIISQEKLLVLLNECKNSGSEVLSVNDIRITANTYIFYNENTIEIDGIKTNNPYIIKAIGDPDLLYSSLARNKGNLNSLQDNGINVTIEKNDNIKIPKTKKELFYSCLNNINNLDKLNNSDRLSGRKSLYGKGIKIYFNSSSISSLLLLEIINDLNYANCFAIEINGNRILSNTDIMDISQKYILLNSIPLSDEFTISAIGDPSSIMNVINNENSIFNKLYNSNINIYIEKKYFFKIKKYEQSRGQNKLNILYATPLT